MSEVQFDAVQFAKAIADDTRQRIMKLCCCDRLSVNDITARMKISQPTVSHHLAILRDAGLVNVARDGRETFYTLNQERLTVCCGQLMVQFAPGEAAKKNLKSKVESQKSKVEHAS